MGKVRLSANLDDERLLRLIKLESQQRGTTMKEVLERALDGYFSHQLELKALQRASEQMFEEWDDPRDGDYDKL